MKPNRSVSVAIAGLLALSTPAFAQNQQERGPEARPPARQEPRPQPAETPPPGAGLATGAPPESPPGPSADLVDLVQRVSQATGRQFAIDSSARKRLYVGGVSLDNPTYPLLLLVLNMNALAAAEVGGRVLIVPVEEARQLPSRIVQSDNENIPDDEWVTRIITVKGDRGPPLVPLLRPLMPQAAHLAAFIREGDSDSKLIVVDRYANVKRLTALVEALSQ